MKGLGIMLLRWTRYALFMIGGIWEGCRNAWGPEVWLSETDD
jgi:hypothetical protein